MPQNQNLYQEFQQTIQMLTQQRADLERDIKLVEQQLENMRKEAANIDQSIILHTGGMSSIEVLTNNGFAITKYEGEIPLTLNPYQAAQAQQAAPGPQAAPSQQQYQQQPTQTAYAPQPAITPQAQNQFAPPPQPLIGEQEGRMTPQAPQQPQMAQGSPQQPE